MAGITKTMTLAALAVSMSACATLGLQIQAPRFAVAGDRAAVLQIHPPSIDRPYGALGVRMWARVENPNPVALTLARVSGDLFLQGERAARVDFPLGVPLPAGQDTVIPLDVTVNPADVPGLADVATRALTGNTIGYRLAGTVVVDAGALGRPGFGPMTLLEGDLETRR